MAINKKMASKLKKMADSFDEGRQMSDGFVSISPGFHIVRLRSIEIDENSDGNPSIDFVSVVVHSEDQESVGETVRSRHEIVAKSGEKDGKSWERTEAQAWQEIHRALRCFGYETDELTIEEFIGVPELVEEDQPAGKIKVVERGEFKNIRYQRPIDDDEGIPDIDDVLSELEDEEEEEVEYDDVEEDDVEEEEVEIEEEEEEDEEEKPIKGSVVKYKTPSGKKLESCKVLTVNNKAETCTLIRNRDKKRFEKVPWAKIK